MVLPKSDPDLLQEIYRCEGRRVYATLVRLLGGFELAEDALQNAFVAAAESWPREGVPNNPFAWLVSAGRYKAIDQLRQQQRMNSLERCRRADRRDRRREPGTGPAGGSGRRSPAADLYLLPPEPVGRGLHRLDLARSVRACDGGHRPCLPADPNNACPADRAGEGQDSRCRHSVPSPGQG